MQLPYITFLRRLFSYLLNMDPHFDLIFTVLKLRNFSTNLFFQHFKFVRPIPKHIIYSFHVNISLQYIVHQTYQHSPNGHVRKIHGKTDGHVFRILDAHVLAADVAGGLLDT